LAEVVGVGLVATMMGHAMADPIDVNPEEFAKTPDHEFQDSHYHDEEPDVVNDELQRPDTKAAVTKKKNRRPPPKPHYRED
jgi:hypothetical protein